MSEPKIFKFKRRELPISNNTAVTFSQWLKGIEGSLESDSSSFNQNISNNLVIVRFIKNELMKSG